MSGYLPNHTDVTQIPTVSYCGTLLGIAEYFCDALRGPPRTYVYARPAAWKAVARVVHERRTELGLTQAEAVEASGKRISLPVWSILENARQQAGRMDARSIDGAITALQLEPEVLYRILSGEDPHDVNDPAPAPLGLAALAGELSPEGRAKVEGYIRAVLEQEGK